MVRNSNNPGLAYDSKRHVIGAWVGGNTVYLYNAQTDTCEAATASGGPAAPQPGGTFGRFAYSPNLDSFILVNGWDEDAWVFHLN